MCLSPKLLQRKSEHLSGFLQTSLFLCSRARAYVFALLLFTEFHPAPFFSIIKTGQGGFLHAILFSLQHFSLSFQMLGTHADTFVEQSDQLFRFQHCIDPQNELYNSFPQICTCTCEHFPFHFLSPPTSASSGHIFVQRVTLHMQLRRVHRCLHLPSAAPQQ